MVTLEEALSMGIKILKDKGIETPVVDAGVLLCNTVGCDRTYLYAHGERLMENASLDRYTEYLRKRSEGMPVQYITGHCEFMSLDFEVGPEVLVPGPDTEVLVETAARMLASAGKLCTVLDIGTGSGCIAVSMAHLLKACMVTAVDISEAALMIARKNAVRNGVSDRLEIMKSDLFGCLDGRRFDAVLSNPPYIRSGDIQSLQREVRDFEPRVALDGGPDGLVFYRKVIGESPRFLNEQGLLAFETGQGQAAEVATLMECYFTGIEIFRDLAGIDRVVTGKIKHPGTLYTKFRCISL